MKKTWLRLVLWGILGLFSAGLVVYFLFPQWLLGFVQWRYERASGVASKIMVIDGYAIPYYEGGKGEPLVLIHGFGDSKVSFVQAAKWLVPHYRVILPEVPGFGETVRDNSRSYHIRAQVQTFHKFFQRLGLTSFHLGGNSMGGHIAAAYTLTYPERVKKLLLLAAAGLKADGAWFPYSPVDQPVKSREDFYKDMKKLFYTVPYIPRPFESYLIKKAQESWSWQNRLRADIRNGPDYLLNDRIRHIKVPALILWGDTDHVVALPVGHAYRKALTYDTWVLMKHCGHIPQYERPRDTAEIILQFLAKPYPTPRIPEPSKSDPRTPEPRTPDARTPEPRIPDIRIPEPLR